MLTIFSTARDFEGHYKVIQRNAIRSWTLLEPQPEIILFGNELGTKEIAQELDLIHVPELALNEDGAPLLNKMFERAQELASNDTICYVNADIILMSDFIEAVKKAQRLKRFLMTGLRWRVFIESELDFDKGWEEGLLQFTKDNGARETYDIGGEDYFVFTRGLLTDMPPLALARMHWDGWLLYYARKRKGDLVDATGAVNVVHQDHDYSNMGGLSFEEIFGSPEANRNLELAGGVDYLWHSSDANYIIDQCGLRKAYLKNRSLERWLLTFIMVDPLRNIIYKSFKSLFDSFKKWTENAFFKDVKGMRKLRDGFGEFYLSVNQELGKASRHIAMLEKEIGLMKDEMDKAGEYIRHLETELASKNSEIARLSSSSGNGPRLTITPDSSAVQKLRFYLKNEGLGPTLERTKVYLTKKPHPEPPLTEDGVVPEQEAPPVEPELPAKPLEVKEEKEREFDLQTGAYDWTRSHVLSPEEAAEVWIDVGAYIGEKSLNTASLNSNILIFAFEPNIKAIGQTFSLLSNYVVIPMAVTETDGFTTFYMNTDPVTNSTLPLDEEGLATWKCDKPIRADSEVVCPTIRLDTFMNLMGIESIDYLKIDAQGADLSVVKSAGERIRDIKRIVLEVQLVETPPYQDSCTKEAVLDYMRDNGFKLVEKEKQSYGQEENMLFVRS